jgi:hypothetical protein
VPGLEEFLRIASDTMIEDCFRVVRTVTSPARIAFNRIEAALTDAETSSRIYRQTSLERKRLHDKFIQFKNHFATSPDRDGKLVYYFLSSIELLPASRRDEMMFRATTFIDSEPESARAKIAQAMSAATERGLALGGENPITLQA